MYRIYRNLRNKCWSIQAKVNGRWKVVKRAKQLAGQDCFFKISEAGRQRVIRDGRKNVHAWIECREVMISSVFGVDSWPRICYDPYNDETFKCNGRPIQQASLVYFGQDGAYLAEDVPPVT